ncbi:MAG TPA: PP0621 family protein [Ramlibacter sp.]|nr:PP0621 family protein [Ramlibacter sp.]
MKYLLVLAVVVVAYMLWRNARLAARDAARKPPPPLPQEMVSCAACGLHLPKADAVAGTNGLLYCSPEHRLRSGS